MKVRSCLLVALAVAFVSLVGGQLFGDRYELSIFGWSVAAGFAFCIVVVLFNGLRWLVGTLPDD